MFLLNKWTKQTIIKIKIDNNNNYKPTNTLVKKFQLEPFKFVISKLCF